MRKHDKANNSYTTHPGLFIWNTQTRVDFVYRGSSKTPESVFSNGLTSRGTNLDILNHIDPLGDGEWLFDSGYVSTSTSKEAASKFPRVLEYPQKGYLYEINPAQNGIQIEQVLDSEIKQGRTFDPDYLEMWRAEKEVAVPYGISSKNIKGAWEIISLGEEMNSVQDTYLINPNYETPFAIRAGQVVKMAGRALTAMGVTLDGINLWRAFEQSQQTNDNTVVIQEGSRIATAWTCAVAVGIPAAKAGALLCSIGGPPSSAACGTLAGAAGGLVGSAFGYWGGSKLVNTAFEKNEAKKEKLSIPKAKVIPYKTYHPIGDTSPGMALNYAMSGSPLTMLVDLGLNHLKPFTEDLSQRFFQAPTFHGAAKDSFNRLSRKVVDRYQSLFPEADTLVRQEVDYALRESIEKELELRQFKSMEEIIASLSLAHLGKSFSLSTGNPKSGDLLNRLVMQEFSKAMNLNENGYPQINRDYSSKSQHRAINKKTVLNELIHHPSVLENDINKMISEELELTRNEPIEININVQESTQRIYEEVAWSAQEAEKLAKDKNDQEKLKAIGGKTRKVQAGVSVFIYAGRIMGNKEVETIGRVAEQAVNIGSSFVLLAAGVINPVFAIAGLVEGLANMLDIFKKKSNEPSELTLLRQEVYALSRQMYDYYVDLMKAVSNVNKNVLLIYKELLNGFEKIARNFQLDRAIAQYNQAKNEKKLNQILDILEPGLRELWTIEIEKCLATINTYNKNLSEMTPKLFEEQAGILHNWLLRLSASPLSTGKFSHIPDHFTPEQMDALISQPGFLMKYVEEKLRILLSIPLQTIGDDPSVTPTIANPMLWIKLAKEMIKLRKQMPDSHIQQYDPYGKELDNLINSGRNIQNFYQGLVQNPELFDRLWMHYASALAQVAQMIHQDHQTRATLREATRWHSIPTLDEISQFKLPVTDSYEMLLSGGLASLYKDVKARVITEYQSLPLNLGSPFYRLPKIVHIANENLSYLESLPLRLPLAPLFQGESLQIPADLSRLEQLGLGQFVITVNHPNNRIFDYFKVKVTFVIDEKSESKIPVAQFDLTINALERQKIYDLHPNSFPPIIPRIAFTVWHLIAYLKGYVINWVSASVTKVQDLKSTRTAEHENSIQAAFQEYKQNNLLSVQHPAHPEFKQKLEALDETRAMLSLFFKMTDAPEEEQVKVAKLTNSQNIQDALVAEVNNTDTDTAANSMVAKNLLDILQDTSIPDYIRQNQNNLSSIYHFGIDDMILSFDALKINQYDSQVTIDDEEDIYDEPFYDAPMAISSGSSIHSNSIFMNSINAIGGLFQEGIRSIGYAQERPIYTRSYSDICADYRQSVNETLALLLVGYDYFIAPNLASNQKRPLAAKESKHLLHMLDELTTIQTQHSVLAPKLCFDEDFIWIQDNIPKLRSEITSILKKNRAKPADIHTIEYKFKRMTETLENLINIVNRSNYFKMK